MIQTSIKHEIDFRTMNAIIGLIAAMLGNVEILISRYYGFDIGSISESYYAGDLARGVFVGFLYAVGSFFLAYTGESLCEKWLSKIAGFAAVGIAMFPCGCSSDSGITCQKYIGGSNFPDHPFLHYLCAGIMFGVLAVFCVNFYRRAVKKKHMEAKRRSVIYGVCSAVIVGSITIMLLDKKAFHWSDMPMWKDITFWCEYAGLMGFGVSWLVKSHILPGISSQEERFSLL
jgi:hypothetical protein